MRLKSFIAAATCAAVVCCVGAGAAFAGEITGPSGPNGGQGHVLYTIDPVTGGHDLQGNSICAFSGQNNPFEPDAGPGRVAVVRPDRCGRRQGFAPSPGVACNGHTGFLAGGDSGE